MTAPAPRGRQFTTEEPAPAGAGSGTPAPVPEGPGAPGAPPHADAEGLEALVAERDEYLDGLQRLKAEFENYRRRADRDRVAAAEGARHEFVGELAHPTLPKAGSTRTASRRRSVAN